MAKLRRLLPLAVLLAAGALHVAPAAATSNQETILQDDGLLKSDPAGTLALLHTLGVTRVRVGLVWDSVATGGRPQDPSDPASAGYNWSIYDTIDRYAQAEGVAVYFMLTGPAPTWATGSGYPGGGPRGAWKPSASQFGAFVHAAGARYSGTFAPASGGGPLPRVSFWTVWNEPNYGPNLAPQATHNDTVEVGAAEYRGLVDAAWAGLTSTGHRPGRDTILIGETAPRGLDHPIGNYSGVKPLRFLRALYCVDSRFRPLRGTAAALRGCPTTAAGSRRFRAQHPALFQASGFAAHLYSSQANPGPPTQPTNEKGQSRVSDPDFADFAQLGKLEATLDGLNRVYGSRTRLAIWNTEFGYRTHPPDPHVRTSPATAALYMNWAEYLSFRSSRLVNYMQYLLRDPPSGVFASGLELANGKPVATYDAFRMPLFLPVGSGRRGRALEVWGGVRPASVAAAQTGRAQQVAIEFQRGGHGRWTRLATVTIHNVRGYFDTRVKFPASGAVRLTWVSPTGAPDHSRTATVSIH